MRRNRKTNRKWDGKRNIKRNIRIRYQLTFVHKLICGGLLLLAFLFFLHPQAYQSEFVYGAEEQYGFGFLQQGDYTLHFSYNESPAENEIIIYSDKLIDENNHPGAELMRVKVGSAAGRKDVTLSLEQDVADVKFKSAQDTEDTAYITYVGIQSVQLQNRDNYLLLLLCVLGACLTLLLGWFVPVEKYSVPAMLVLLGFAASIPLFSDFAISGDDFGFHVARLESIYRGLKAGEFPVYLGSNKMGGFGMLSATMYPDFFLYPFAILRLFGVSLMLCYKLLLVCIHIGSAFTAYYAAKAVCRSDKIALWTGIFYTFALYRLTNVYFRASLGESLAMVFLPIVIWGIYEVLWGTQKKWFLLTLGMSGVIQSHVLSAEMCTLFLSIEVLVWLISRKGSCYGKRILAGLKAAGLTVLLNAFFLVPFLYFCGEKLQCFEMPNQLEQTGVYFSQMFALFPPAQGRDMELGSMVGEMPHTIGFVLLLGSILLCIEAFREKESSTEMQVGKRCLVYGAFALLMSSWLFPWDKLQNMELLHDLITSLQFAWRFHGPASALLSIAASVGVVRFAERMPERKWMYAVCAVLIICSTAYFFDRKGSLPNQYSDKMAFNDFGHTDSMYLYSDGESFQAYHLDYDASDAYIITAKGTPVEYSGYERKGMQLKVQTSTAFDTEDYLEFPFYYYPGYVISVNGEAVEVLSVDSRVACEMPVGIADIEVHYEGVPGHAVANGISLLTTAGIFIVFIDNRRRTMIHS